MNKLTKISIRVVALASIVSAPSPLLAEGSSPNPSSTVPVTTPVSTPAPVSVCSVASAPGGGSYTDPVTGTTFSGDTADFVANSSGLFLTTTNADGSTTSTQLVSGAASGSVCTISGS